MRNLFVIDVETGGLDPTVHALLAVGGVVVDRRGQVMGAIELYVSDPEGELTPEALRVNRINPESLREATRRSEMRSLLRVS